MHIRAGKKDRRALGDLERRGDGVICGGGDDHVVRLGMADYPSSVPKRPKLPEADLHAMIVQHARYRRGCPDFAPDFTLRERSPAFDGSSGGSANWDVASMRGAESWPPDCAEAFREAVATARRNFDIDWNRDHA